jgi:hypothetical protein
MRWICFGIFFWVIGGMIYIPKGDIVGLIIGVCGSLIVANELTKPKQEDDNDE